MLFGSMLNRGGIFAVQKRFTWVLDGVRVHIDFPGASYRRAFGGDPRGRGSWSGPKLPTDRGNTLSPPTSAPEGLSKTELNHGHFQQRDVELLVRKPLGGSLFRQRALYRERLLSMVLC
jgi:hypothetical protein